MLQFETSFFVYISVNYGLLFTNLLKYIIIKLIFLQKATKRVLCSAAFFMRINFMQHIPNRFIFLGWEVP